MEGPADEAKCVTDLFNEIVAKTGGGKPQMMVFLLAGKDSICYERIKKSCDCRYGVVSQCMQNAHVKRGQGQYISNVLMKFNAKLGGTTSKVGGVSDALILSINTDAKPVRNHLEAISRLRP